jgi:chromate reductase
LRRQSRGVDMDNTLNLVGLVGSLRAASFNRALLDAAVVLLPEGVDLVEAPLRDVPFYDGDVEQVGDPESVQRLKSAVERADGLLIFTPEYNRGVPAVVKNAIDWLSRPHGSGPLSDATVGIVASTPGGHTAAGVLDHLAASVSANTQHLHQPSLGLPSIAAKIERGALTDPDTRREVAQWLAAFVADVRRRVEPRATASAAAGA